MTLPPLETLLTTARQRADAGAWREVADLLAAYVEEHPGATDEAVLFADAILYLGEERRALAFLRRRLPNLAESKDRALYRRAVNMMGVASFAVGELEEANTALHAALDMATEDDDPLLLAQATNNLGAIANLQGRHEDALWHYRLAIPTLQRIGKRQRLANAYHNIAITFRDTGNLQEADEHERRAIEYATESEVPRLAAMGRVGRAEIAMRRGDAPLAEMTALLALGEFKRLGDSLNEADACRLIGAACSAQRHYDAALESFEQALDIARARAYALNEAETLRDRVETWMGLGQVSSALEDAREAIAIFDRLGATRERDALERRVANIR